MLSLPHLTVLFLIALIVFGPQKLPELARMLGKAMAEFRKVTGDVRRVVQDEMNEMERQARDADIRKREADLVEREKALLPPSGDAPAPLPDGEVIAGTVPATPPSTTRAEALAVTVVPAPESPEGKPDA